MHTYIHTHGAGKLKVSLLHYPASRFCKQHGILYLLLTGLLAIRVTHGLCIMSVCLIQERVSVN